MHGLERLQHRTGSGMMAPVPPRNGATPILHSGQDETTFAFESIESFLVALLIEFLLALGDVFAVLANGRRRNRFSSGLERGPILSERPQTVNG